MAIKDTRSEAQKRLTAVQRKIARLRREKGVEINGSRHDVRISRERISKMNSRELNTFIKRANEFTSRSTQFEAGAHGAPLPAKIVRSLERKETILRGKNDAIVQDIGDLQAPFTGMSLKEREQMRPTVRAGGEPFARTFEPVKTRIQDVRSEEALRKLDEYRSKQLSPTYARERVNSARDELDKMLTKTGHDFFKARVKNLTDEQFFTMWEYGPFAGDVSTVYEVMKAMEEQNELSETDRQIFEDLSYDINEAITWAENTSPRINLGAETSRRREPGQRAQARARAEKRRARRNR